MRRTTGTAGGRIAAAALGLLLVAGCSSADGGTGEPAGHGEETASPTADPGAIPGVDGRLEAAIPGKSRQVVAVYGEGKDSPSATVALYAKKGDAWHRERSWPAHNGKRGWSPDHREGDDRSPVGVFTLSDAGGVLADPGARLPYTQSASFAAPHYWPKSHWHDFDLVLAIDYNRVRGTSPLDPTRPRGQEKGGGIWFHMDHGSGTSGCVSLSKQGMTYLLRALDPAEHPVAVMGDRASLAGESG